jgi:hypothetical protein
LYEKKQGGKGIGGSRWRGESLGLGKVGCEAVISDGGKPRFDDLSFGAVDSRCSKIQRERKGKTRDLGRSRGTKEILVVLSSKVAE